MRWATRLIACGVRDGRAAVLLHDNAHGQILTARGSGTTLARDAARRRPRFYWGASGGLSNISFAAATWSSSPVNSTSSRSWATTDSSALSIAPARLPHEDDVGELPPPQRLGGVAEAEVAQAVLEVAGDAGQVVGELAVDLLGVVGVEDEAVGVDVAEHVGQPQPQAVEVGVGADVGLVVLLGREVDLGAEPGAGQRGSG